MWVEMIVRLRLFVSSYAPLFAVSAIRFDSRELRWAFGLMTVLAISTLLLLVRTSARGVAPRQVVATEVQDLGSDVAAYIATYLLPFVAVDRPGASDLVAYALVLLVLAVVYVNSDLIGVNPLLYLLGYRVYGAEGVRVDSSGGCLRAVLISKSQVRPGTALTVTDLASGVMLVRSDEKEIT